MVYPVRPGDDNEELRFSLRTLESNFPHGRVWIVGYKPNWVTDVEFIPGNSRPYRHANIYHNILAASLHPDTPDRFVIFNDDFFITERVEDMPILFRGLLRDHMQLPQIRANPHNWWGESLRATMTCLQTLGHPDPISYELHVPFVVDKGAMAEVLRGCLHVQPENPPQWRSLYGNMHGIGGRKSPDCKVMNRGPVKTPFHSTSPGSWRRYYAAQFQRAFPAPSRYEKA